MGHDTINKYIDQLIELDLLDEVGDSTILKAKGTILDQPKDKYVRRS